MTVSTAALLAVSPLAYGQTVWNGAGADDFWFTALNWDTGVVPPANDDVIVGNPFPTVVNGNVSIDTLAVLAPGELTVGVSQSLDLGSNGALTSLVNAGDITVGNNADLGVARSVDSSGQILVASTGNQTDLELRDDTEFTGGGIIRLSGPNAGINDDSGTRLLTLTDQTIVGVGNVGRNTINVINAAGSVIGANKPSGTLIVDAAATVVNQGEIRSVNGGTLQLNGGAYDNTGGVIESAGPGSVVSLQSGVDITGGLVQTSPGGGTMSSVVSSNISFTDLTFNGLFTAGNNSDTQILGTITNTGTFSIASTGNQTDLEVAVGGATLTGGGSVVLSGPLAGINDASGTQLLTIADQTIEGNGDIGRNTTDIDNQGNLIEANVPGQALVLDALNAFINTGTLRASGDGILVLRAGGADDFVNAGGTIEALAGSEVRLESGARVVGGTLRSVGTGAVTSTVSSNTVWENLAFDGSYTAGNNSDTQILGTITNTGTLNITSTGNQTDLELAVGGATLTGGGSVVLSGPLAGINDASGTQLLTIANQTIEGNGDIGRNTTNIDNQGNLIEANVPGQALVLDAADIFTNTGTLRASGGGILLLRDGGTDDFVNAGGTIEALVGSEVRLESGARIIGGTLRSVGAGVVTSTISSNVELDNLAFDGSYTSGNNSDTRIVGTITNTGTLNIASNGNQTDLEVGAGSATLTGGGEVVLSGAFAGINDSGGTQVLTIADQTVRGHGNVGRNTLDVVNTVAGTIRADDAVNALSIDVAGTGSWTNDGTLDVANGATLEIAGDLTSTATSTLSGNGTISAGTGDIFANGLISAGASPGTLTLDAVNVDLEGTTTVFAEIGGLVPGTGFDVVNVTGNLSLDGELSVFVSGMVNPLGQTFEIVTSADLDNSFDNVLNGGSLATTDNAYTFTVNYGVGSAFAENSVVLSNFEAVPEPGALVVAGLGGLALLGRRRRQA